MMFFCAKRELAVKLLSCEKDPYACALALEKCAQNNM
jgi:hypothetical protein